MINSGDKIVVGVSGGPDSVALIHILRELAPELNFVTLVAHVNHNLRPSSRAERDFVANLSSQHGLDFFDLNKDVRAYARERNLSLEEAGRRVRYSFFEELLERLDADKIATAHHLDDQIETFFLRILRGATMTGLRGIPAVRGPIIRPLIKLERSQIIDYLEANNIPYLIDETNLKPDTDRNFVRNVILKNAAERFPGYRKSVLRSIDLITRDEDFLENSASQLYAACVTSHPGEKIIDIRQLLEAHHSVSSRVIRKTLYELTGPDIRLGEVHIRQVFDLCSHCSASSRMELPGGVKLRRKYDKLILSQKLENASETYSYIVKGPGSLRIAEAGYTLKFSIQESCKYPPETNNDPNVVYFDLERLSFPLEVRSFLHGDRLEPWGMEGSTRIKKIFIDRKIFHGERRKIPLIVKDSRILWIAGVRRSRFFGVTGGSRKILQINFIRSIDPKEIS